MRSLIRNSTKIILREFIKVIAYYDQTLKSTICNPVRISSHLFSTISFSRILNRIKKDNNSNSGDFIIERERNGDKITPVEYIDDNTFEPQSIY